MTNPDIRNIIRLPKKCRLDMLNNLLKDKAEIQKSIDYIQLHLNDIEPIDKYDTKLSLSAVSDDIGSIQLNYIQVSIINYLILKCNVNSIGVSLGDIAFNAEVSAHTVKHELDQLIDWQLVNMHVNEHLGTIYSLNKERLQQCR